MRLLATLPDEPEEAVAEGTGEVALGKGDLLSERGAKASMFESSSSPSKSTGGFAAVADGGGEVRSRSGIEDWRREDWPFG
jgi:hypothetical protein